ncbi:glycerol-3-phosphate dehydrogenase [Acetobacteraceae bacterium]|nr:glycerol-3-phosphate dehydrogenase [Acetobacteraceae bacterium]
MRSKNTSSLHIIGAGAWGSALAIAYSRFSTLNVILWSRKELNKNQPFPRLSNFVPPEKLHLRQGLPTENDLSETDIIFFATPMWTLRQVSSSLPRSLSQKISLVTCCKGLEKETELMPLEVLKEIFPLNPNFVLAGPNFAKEVAQDLPAVATLSGEDEGKTQNLSDKLSLPTFFISPDLHPIAIQIMGAAKNVAAIGVGATIGVGLGENARAAFITCFLQEIHLLIKKKSGDPKGIFTFGAIGDLFLTATSSASRNYALGEYLGKHKTYPPHAGTDKVAITEGAFTAPVLLEMAERFKIDLPAINAVNKILRNPSETEKTIRSLLSN